MHQGAMPTINLAAERRRSAQRRERDHLRARARRILAGRWDMTALEIGAAIEEAYPDMEDEQQRLLAAATRQVQRDEAPRKIPVGSVEVQPWEPDDPRMEINRSDARAWTEILASGLKSRTKSNPNAMPQRRRKEPKPAPKQKRTGPPPKPPRVRASKPKPKPKPRRRRPDGGRGAAHHRPAVELAQLKTEEGYMRAVWILEWARERHSVPISDPAADVILVALLFGHREGRPELARRIGIRPANMDKRLQACGLPTLQAWANLGRVLHAAELLQDGMSRPAASMRLGYVSSSALSHLTNRNTGYSPTEVADLDGWQEPVRGWWEIQGMATNKDRRVA